MSKLKTIIGDIAFPWEVDVIEVGSEGTERRCAVALLCGCETVLDTTCEYDTDGLLTLYDISSLVDGYLDDKVKECELRLDGEVAAQWTMIPCRVVTDITASVWVNKYMLTLQRGEKQTVADAIELTSWYQDRAGSVKIDVEMLWNTGNRLVSTSWSSTVEAKSGINTYSLNLGTLTPPEDGAELEGVQLTAGGREVRYAVKTADCPVRVIFVNCFGCRESIVLTGGVERDLKPVRSSAQTRGKHHVYKVESVPTWKVGTGNIPDGMAGVVDDLVRARKLWLSDGGTETELSLTDSDWNYRSDLDQMCSGSVTWRLSSKMQRRKSTSGGSGIFDETFDETFN